MQLITNEHEGIEICMCTYFTAKFVLINKTSQCLIISTITLQKPVNELGKAYVDFMRGNLDILRQKIIDELFVLSIFEVRL